MKKKRERGYTGRLEVGLDASLLGQGAVTALAIMLLGATFYMQLPLVRFAVVLLVIAGLWAWVMHRMNNPAWRKLLLSPDGQIVLAGRNRQSRTGALAGKPLVTPFVIRLVIKAGDGSRHRAWIFADSVKGAQFQRLGAALRRKATEL